MEQGYTGWIKRYILHFDKRHPRDMGASQVEQFLAHLAVSGKVSVAKLNQALIDPTYSTRAAKA